LIKTILPPATIGIVGGGQLGQMMALSAKSMGYKVGILDPTPDAPAAQVADFQIIASYDNEVALLELAHRSAVLTYEFENVAEETLQKVTAYTSLPQGVNLLHVSGQRLREKNFLKNIQIPVTNFASVTDASSLEIAIEKIGYQQNHIIGSIVLFDRL